MRPGAGRRANFNSCCAWSTNDESTLHSPCSFTFRCARRGAVAFVRFPLTRKPKFSIPCNSADSGAISTASERGRLRLILSRLGRSLRALRRSSRANGGVTLDTSGREVLKPQFDEARNFHNNHSPVRVGNRWGFIHKDGSYGIPLRFDLALSFQDERARVRMNGKWGFIQADGS